METSEYMNIDPRGIEEKSMQIISRELSHLKITGELEPVIKRIVHTTADFEYAHLVEAHPDALTNGKKALLSSCKIYADTSMIIAGTSKPSLHELDCEIHCYVHDENVIQKARDQGTTRSICSIDEASEDRDFKVFIIGNAPTALNRICELVDEGRLKPDLVIGVPVGFVGAAESKERLKQTGIPYIITRGRKGGSTVGVAIINAMLYNLVKNK